MRGGDYTEMRRARTPLFAESMRMKSIGFYGAAMGIEPMSECWELAVERSQELRQPPCSRQQVGISRDEDVHRGQRRFSDFE